MTELMKVAEVLKEIQSLSGKIEKKEKIAEHKDNHLFESVLGFIYNPYIKTNVAIKKLEKKVSVAPTKKFVSIGQFMVYLASCTGKDEDVANIQQYAEEHPEELRWLINALATKNLKIGATDKTINEAFGRNLIPSFSVMLADKYIDIKRGGKIIENWKRFVGGDVIVTPKLNGNRCAIVRNESGTVMYSRSGQVLEGYSELAEELEKLPVGFVFDGELIAKNENGLNSKELFQLTQSVTRKKGEKKDVEFHVFDMLKEKEFLQGVSNKKCEERKRIVGTLVNHINSDLIKYVEPLYIGMFDEEVIARLSNEAKQDELEGVMVQCAKAPYESKRTKNILKVKVFESADLLVTGYYEGKEASRKGTLGGLIVDYKGHPVNVGGGYNEAERQEFWDNREDMVGKIIEVMYFEETENLQGGISLRFPQFKALRVDKTEPSYF